jgi:hypothetical protein
MFKSQIIFSFSTQAAKILSRITEGTQIIIDDLLDELSTSEPIMLNETIMLAK